MGDQRNYAALDWVMGEIEETLNEARQALEAFVADPKDSTRLRFCITHIHQVRGSLQIVEFHGASLLAEEMEQLAQAMMDQSVSNYSDAQEVLMRSLLQLPIYLDHVKVYRDDSARTILPLLNDLRAVRNERYLSETNLFSPDLSSLDEVLGNSHPVLADTEKLKQVTKKLREMYQFAAASVLRGIKVDENLEYIEKVFSRLEVLSAGTKIHPLWQASSALIDGLKNDDIELSVAVRGLLRHLARELRLMSEQAPDAFNATPREGLFKNILYYIARSESKREKLRAVKDRFGLRSSEMQGNEENVDGYSVSALDPEAVRSVVVALREELKSIKSKLDNALTANVSPSEIAEVLPVVKRVGDTLAVLGIAELRRKMLDQADLLEAVSKQNSVEESQLTAIASEIIEVDNKLEAIGKAVDRHRDLASINERVVEIDEAKLAVIRECTVGLERAKDAIIEYISSQWDASRLENIDHLLTDIRGGLDIIPLPRPAAVIDSCSRFITEKLRSEGYEPEWKVLESLADAMASVEYYLERISGDMSEDADSLLEVAEDSVESLGFPVKSVVRVAPQVVDDAVQAVALEEAQAAQTLQQETAAEAPAIEQAAEFEATNNLVEPEVDEQAAASNLVEETAPEPVVEASVEDDERMHSEPEFESDIDEEIIEVFIEEAAEVQETLNENLPLWAQNPNNEEALTIVRRSFHTLKGSGRMVEAMEIGELAWSIENMLNRVIDQTVQVAPEHAALAQAVTALFPRMVKAFEARRHNPERELTERYSRWAFELAEGNIPANLIAELNGASNEQAAQPEAEPYEEPESDDGEDDVLLEIFSSEAETHLATIADFIAQMEEEAPLYSPPTDNLQRALHTLKGSARMAQVNPIASMFEVLENFAKELVTFQVAINDDILQLIRDAQQYTEECLRAVAARADVEISRLDQFIARTAELRELAVGPLVRMKEQEKDGEKPVDPQLLSIFMAEEMRLLLDADELLDKWLAQAYSFDEMPALQQELRTLAEGADRAKLPDMSEFSRELVAIYEVILADNARFNAENCLQLKRIHEALLDMVDAVAAGQNLVPPAPAIRSELIELRESLQRAAESPADNEAVEEISLELNTGDALESEPTEDEDAIPYFESIDVDESEEPQDLVDSEEQIESFESSELPAFDESLGASYSVDEASSADISNFEFNEQPLNNDSAPDAENYSAAHFSEQQEEPDTSAFEPAAEELSAATSNDDSAFTADNLYSNEDFQQPSLEATPQAPSDLVYEENSAVDAAEMALTPSGGDLIDVIDADAEDYDPDILDIFLEEAQELFEELDEAINEWEREPSSEDGLEQMKRALHTMKGGARLAGLPNLGELVHNYESYIIAADLNAIDGALFATVHAYQDRIDRAVNAVRRLTLGEDVSVASPDEIELVVEAPPEAIASNTAEPEQSHAEEAPTEQAAADDELPSESAVDPVAKDAEAQSSPHNVIPFVSKPKAPAEFEGPAVGSGPVTALKKAGPQEVVRVNSELLEELVNLAGETSISRSRLEEQVTEFGLSLDEIDSTIDRLQEQLRRLDIETEAQILFRQEQMAVHSEDFDPLEMDRYSALQQLSRSLIESASDLYDLRSELTDKVKDAETILLQQSRINTTLQEGLMRSRMVPFSRMVPRLRRIVRQVSSELGKKVSLELDNVEGELDRNVLERMVPPFEHMLRNAVDHGIEDPEARIAAGKSETGRIVLTLGREGGDVIIRLADDGQGVDLKRVKEKAIERGLMTENADLSDYDIMQFILHAGFSTAENVTQISGRGVGMDVVHAEIKQLGGDVAINSSWGKGTEFVIRLPFTLSVNRALMVNIGQDHFAIPLNAIEGIVRISPFELEHYYENPDAEFEYANEKYKVRFLGSMLYPGMRANLEGHVLPLPIILVRTAQHTMALQVDGLMGSREIVVKSLGQQFSNVQGLSGATVMGDGSVVVILDPHAMVRQEIANADLLLEAAEQARITHDLEAEETARIEKVYTVMVVDDSVTVRKVTTRFLEREGYNVITAKDGVDALQILQDEMPDVMLLDIEMPRMDGFEVAKNIRTTQRWKELPIIMITSRTGEKHREHALSLGVNRYMGKPYQEDALMESISELLGEIH